MASASTLSTLLLGGLAAFAVVRWRGVSEARDRMMVALLATRLLPPVVIVIPVYVMAQAMGGVDTWWVLIAVYTATSLPLALWLLRDGFADVPSEILDAAELDGASFPALFFTMAVPLARASIAATGLIVFVLSWNEYTFALLLTTDDALTMPPFLAGQMAVREQMASAEPQWDYFSVLIVLMVAPLMAGAGLLQRLLSRAFVSRVRH